MKKVLVIAAILVMALAATASVSTAACGDWGQNGGTWPCPSAY